MRIRYVRRGRGLFRVGIRADTTATWMTLGLCLLVDLVHHADPTEVASATRDSRSMRISRGPTLVALIRPCAIQRRTVFSLTPVHAAACLMDGRGGSVSAIALIYPVFQLDSGDHRRPPLGSAGSCLSRAMTPQPSNHSSGPIFGRQKDVLCKDPQQTSRGLSARIQTKSMPCTAFLRSSNHGLNPPQLVLTSVLQSLRHALGQRFDSASPFPEWCGLVDSSAL